MPNQIELKFMPQTTQDLMQDDDLNIRGYASLFGERDHGGDCVMPGAFKASLKAAAHSGRPIKMLWQHDPAQPIGIWDDVAEDSRGLYVTGRLLPNLMRAQEAKTLLSAGAIDGLSIGYQVVRARPDGRGGRFLDALDLWEISLVTFPMLPSARIDAKAASDPVLTALEQARAILARPLA